MTNQHREHVADQADGGEIERSFSGTDAGGMFGGDGGVLNREPSNQLGWLERLDTQRSAEVMDVEKAKIEEKEDGSETATVVPDEWEVGWEEGEAANPRNFANWKKWACVYVVSSGGLCV
jgi:hypothetical protein